MIECVTKFQKHWYLLNEKYREGEVNCTTWLSVLDAICGKNEEKKNWSKTQVLSYN